MMELRAQLEELLGCVSDCVDRNSANIIAAIEGQSKLLLEWLPYLNSQKTGIADELLDGAISSLKESAACAGLGLVRPSLLAMRTEIDLILSWLYFKDHEVEWSYLNLSGDGFKLKKEILEYFARYYFCFNSRYGILKEIISRKEVDPYRLLSAHIHSQSLSTLPFIHSLKDIVGEDEVLKELPIIAHEVDEYISDVLFSIFQKSWTQVPNNLIASLQLRFKTKAQENLFFNGKVNK